MTRDNIIRMAREAGLPYSYQTGEVANLGLVERFAALVAAYTLSNIDPSKFMSFQEGMEAGCLAEREACAQVCEDNKGGMSSYFKGEYAAAIRARGEE